MKRDVTFAFIGALIVAAVTYGLAVMRPAYKPTATQPFQANAPKRDVEKVIMHVNGEPVTLAEFNAFLQQAPEQMQAVYASPEGRSLLAGEIAKVKALEQEGRRLGVQNEPETRLRLTMAEQNIIAGMALQKLVAQPTDQQIRSEYEKEKGKLDTVELAHILIAYQGGTVPPRQGAPLPPDQAMQKANAVYQQLAGGADFASAARAVSDDPESAANGGRIGQVSPESLPPDLGPVVAQLKPGQVSKPVRSSFGIHIFKAGPRQSRPFEEVRQMFAAKLQRDQMEQTVSKLQKQAKVELDPKFFPPEQPNAAVPPGLRKGQPR